MCQQLKFLAFLLSAMFCITPGFSRAEPQCALVNRTVTGLEKICGYEYTASFEYGHHFSSASNAVTSLKNLLKNCSDTVGTMICSLFVPRCTEEIKGPYLPCRAVCYDYATKCKDIIKDKGLEWTVAMCDILPERDNLRTTKGYRERCFTPPNFKDSGTSYKHKCSDIVVPACKGIKGYTKTVVSEEVQRKYSAWMESKIKYNVNDTCSQPRKEIMCAENLPACIDGTAGFLCRDSCYKFFNTCDTPFFYHNDMCMEFPTREDTPKDLVICKQTHWPRAENWKLTEHPVTTGPTVTPTNRGSSTKTATANTATGKRHTVPTETGNSIKTDNNNVLPPGMHARGQPEGKKSSSSKLTIGLVVTFILLLLLAIGIVGYFLYRRKRSHQFDYQKQVLYSDDKAEEFEIFT